MHPKLPHEAARPEPARTLRGKGASTKKKMTSFKQVGRPVGEEESEGRSQQEGSSRKVLKRFVRRVREEKQGLKEKTKRAGNSALSILARTLVPRVCGISRSSPPGLVFWNPRAHDITYGYRVNALTYGCTFLFVRITSLRRLSS